MDKLQIITVQQILDDERLNLPPLEETTKKAQKAKIDAQPSLLVEPASERDEGNF